jgi:hypothetical protein
MLIPSILGGLRMNKVSIDLTHCYGIKALKTEFDFSKERAYAIYAPNGVMKSSLAETFQMLQDGKLPTDRIFTERKTVCNITDESGNALAADSIFVICPYDGDFDPGEKTAVLLVNHKLRKEYQELHRGVSKAKEALLKAIKKQSKSRRDFEAEISGAVMSTSTDFKAALYRIRKEVSDLKELPLKDVDYDVVFDDRVLNFLDTNQTAKQAIAGYVKRYNELLAASKYFKKGTFDYYNAGQIAKTLASNGFFEAQHTVNLKGPVSGKQENREIQNQKQLEEVISAEKDAILTDPALRKQFDDLQKPLEQNATLRDFYNYLLRNEPLVSQFANIKKFKEDVLKSYLKEHFALYSQLMEEYDSAEKREEQIKAEAAKERTQWEAVIDEFNSRFAVPFKLVAKNREAVMMEDDTAISLGFVYRDGHDERDIDRKSLVEALSTGERKALYVLNILFELRTREVENRETLVVVDDIADSFDYQNKYAIIQYLRDISQNPLFKQLILTHNFDFFRTVKLRFVSYGHCRMATKTDAGIQLGQAAGIENIFVNDWKQAFFTDPKKKIASIAFMRNLVEFTRGMSDPVYVKLTSLLHWKQDSAAITEAELDAIYNSLFTPAGNASNSTKPVVEIITEQAQDCLAAGSGLNFENKIVLSIAIRLAAEQFMVNKISDPGFVAAISKNQTYELLKKFKEKFPNDTLSINLLERVSIMTPENIHLNSFMYEPIVDMSDAHLRKLCQEVVAIR